MSPRSGMPAKPLASRAIAHTGMAEAVVGGAFVGIGKHLVRLACLLEFVFRGRVVRISVRMELHGELAVGALQLLIRGGALYT